MFSMLDISPVPFVVTPHDGRRRFLGSIANPIDGRDRTLEEFARSHKMKSGFLPRRVDLRGGCSPVEDQDELGSCTQNALAGVLEYLYMAKHGGVLDRDCSRLFGYWNARRMMGVWYINQDCGATTRATVASGARFGMCDEKIWPYDISKFRDKPGVDCYRNGLDRRITEYASLYGANGTETLDNIRKTLASGFPVLFGTEVWEKAFMSPATAANGVVFIPDPANDVNDGGHELVFVGYYDDAQMLIFRNSWNVTWGVEGYGFMPYAYVLKAIARDFTVISGETDGSEAVSGLDKLGREVKARYYYAFGHTMQGAA